MLWDPGRIKLEGSRLKHITSVITKLNMTNFMTNKRPKRESPLMMKEDKGRRFGSSINGKCYV